MASSFPRVGPGSAVPVLGKRIRPTDQTQQQQLQPKDTLFGLKRLTRIEVAPVKGAKKGSKRSSALTTVLPTATPGKDATQVDPLSFTRYSVGSLAIGYVLHFATNFVVISLPGGVTGTVALEDISDTVHHLCNNGTSSSGTSPGVRRHAANVPTMQELLSLMQPVRCYVKEASITDGTDSKKKKTLVLSLRSSLVNRGLALKHFSVGFPVSGCVSSLEDHGYIISAGVSCTFFLPFARSEADGAKAKDASASPALIVGQPVECLVQEVNVQARSVTLRTHRAALVKALVNSTVLPFNALFPGMKLLVQVDAVIQNGLRVKFLDQFYGVVDSLSLPMPMSEKEMRAYFTTLFTDRSFEARIVFIDHGNRIVRFSMRPHVVELRAAGALPTLGSIVNNATVKLANKRRGVLLCLASEDALAEVQLLDVEASQARVEAVDGKKGAKLTAAIDKRRRDAEEQLVGIFVHKSALAEVDDDDDEDDDETDESDDDGDEDEQPKKKTKGKDKGKDKGKSHGAAAAVTPSRLVDAEQLERQYRTGSLVREVRVLGYHLVEGFVVGSTMNLNSKNADRDAVYHWSQIATGQVLRATIFKVQDFGLVVKLAPKIKAVCPALHVSEIGMTSVQLKKKFKSGQAIRVRVWETNDRAIIVTNKKSLVEDADPLVRGYDDMVRGRCALGVVSKVSEEGLKVHFSSDVKGLVTMPVLVKQGVMDVTESYRLGQVVRCAVVLKRTTVKKHKKTGVETSKHRVFLALTIGDFASPAILALLEGQDEREQPSEKPSTTKPAAAQVQSADAGSSASATESASASASGTDLVSGVVYKVEKEALAVRLVDGRLATLHKNQCADFAATADVIFPSSAEGSSSALFAVGSKIEGALVLSTVKKVANLTMKPLLLAAARASPSSAATGISLPSTATELAPGQLVAGFIVKMDTYGVLVRFRESLTALVPRPNVADKFVATPEGLFRVGDAVRCVVQRVDLERERVIATFKSGVVSPSSGDTCFLSALLRESYLAAKHSATVDDKTLSAWQHFRVSQVVRATVVSVESYGVVLCAADMVTMMLARGVHAGSDKMRKQLVAGKSAMDVAVLDFDSKNKVLEVSMDELLLAKLAASSESSKVTKKRKGVAAASSGSGSTALATLGSKLQARVELVKERYLVASVDGEVAYVMVADYHCPHVSCTSTGGDSDHHFTEHQEISVVVVKASLPASAAGTSGGWHDSVAVLSIFHEKPTAMGASSSSLSTASAEQRSLPTSADSGSDKKAPEVKFMESLRLGAVFPWTVVSVSPLEVVVRPHSRALAAKIRIRASIHVTGAVDHTAGCDDVDKVLASSADAARRSAVGPGHPFFGIAAGDKLLARIIQLRADERDKGEKGNDKASSESIAVYLSMEGLSRPVAAAAPAAGDEDSAAGAKRKRTESVDSVSGFVDPSVKWSPMVQLWGKNAVRAHSVQAGVVTKIEDSRCVVSISPYISARLHFLDVSSEIAVARLFRERCFVGLRVVVAVTGVIADATTGRPKSISISRLPVEQYLVELGVAPAANAADAKSSKKKAKKADASSAASVSGAAAVDIAAMNKVAATKPTVAADALPAEGSVVTGVLLFDLSQYRIRIPQAPAVLVSLGSGVFGRVCLTELADPQDWEDCSALVAFMAKTAEQAAGAGKAPTVYGMRHGDFVECRVLPSKTNSSPAQAKAAQKLQFVNLSLRPSRLRATSAAVAVAPSVLAEEGSIVDAFVQHTSAKGCFLRLSDAATGQVLIKELSDEFVADPAKAYPAGMLVKARLQSHGRASTAEADDSSPTMPKLSMKASVIEGDARASKEIARIKVGAIVEGVVQRVASAGVFVQLKGTSLVGLSRKQAAVDDEDGVRDLGDFFKAGDLVRARVLTVSTKSKKISLGLRSSFFSKKMIGGSDEVEEAEEEEEEDEEEDGDDDEDDDDEDDDDEDDDEDDDDDDEEEDEEDDVGNRIRMIDGDSDDEEMDAMIKAATIQFDDDEEDDEDEEDDSRSRKKGAKASSSSKGSKASASFGADEDEGDDDDDDEEDDAPKNSSAARAGGLQFQWGDFLTDAGPTAGSGAKRTGDDEDEDDDDDNDDGDEEDDEPAAKRVRTKAKEALRRKQEDAIRRKEAALVDGSAHPERPKDFERLLLAEPRSSVLWMKYMAHHLMEADIDAARAIAERALRTIDFREEEEKMNVWIAFVNLEHKYGSMDTLNAVFKRAVAESRGKYIHLNLAEAYEKAEDATGATAIFEKALKKYKKSKKVWMAYQQFKLRSGDHVAARALLARSMQSLSQHKHVEVLLKYASAEFDFGSGDRGRSVFEELVASYPKRTDLWHVYVDKEIKCGYHDRARQLFERMIASKANPKNIKTVFKKYMGFEQVHGSSEQQEGVKRKAREYVSRLT